MRLVCSSTSILRLFLKIGFLSLALFDIAFRQNVLPLGKSVYEALSEFTICTHLFLTIYDRKIKVMKEIEL